MKRTGKNRTVQRRRAKSSHLEYGALENRLALTTFVVNTTVDDGSGAMDGMISLREAIIAANTNAAFGDAPAGAASGDTIRFDSSLNGSTLTLTQGQLVISDDLQIQGGQQNITIDGNGNSRIFLVSTNERVALGGLTYTGGIAGRGGAIFSASDGPLLVVNSRFTGNEANGVGGGAIFSAVGNLYVTNSTFESNMATAAGGRGGAVYVESGIASFRDGSFMMNEANSAGGAIEIVAANFYATNITVGGIGSGNIAGPVGSANPGNGGGIHVSGASNVYLSSSSITGNYAAREGGGLWNSAAARMVLRNSDVVSNVAAGNDSHDGGGGIFNNAGELVLRSTVVAQNTATGTNGSGGGIFSNGGTSYITGSSIQSNTANRAGGGIEVGAGRLWLVNSELGGAAVADGNIAGTMSSATPGSGGGLHVTGTGSEVYIRDSNVQNNQAAAQGGGLWNQDASLIRADNTTITDNTASGSTSMDGGGGVYNAGGRLTFNSVVISGNAADGAMGSGGGIFSTAGTVLVNNSTIDSNIAARAGGGVEVIDGYNRFANVDLTGNDVGTVLTAAPGNGGGLHVSGNESRTVFLNSTISGNTAANQGAGLWNQSGSTIVVRDMSLVGSNGASGIGLLGGGVYNKGHLQVIDAAFESNTAEDGGAIYLTPGASSQVLNSSFATNMADDEGGAIYNDGYLDVQDSSFNFNVAGTDGGGIYTNQGATTLLSNNSFVGNVPNDTN